MDPLYTQHIQLSKQDISEQLSLFYKEDKVAQDLSTLYATHQNDPHITATLVAEQNLVVAGLSIIDVMFENHDIIKHKKDGDWCAPYENICNISAPASILLSY